MERAGLHDPAPDRRRDDVADPHRGQDRAGLLGPGRPRRSMRRGRSASPARSSSRTGATRSWPGSATSTRTVRRERAGRRAKEKRADDRRGPRQPRADRLGDGRRRRARRSSAPRTFADYPLAELVDYIDWTPFFATWELRGAYPAILDDPRLGAGRARPPSRRARPARPDRRASGSLTANAVVGFWPANTRRRRHRGLARRGRGRDAAGDLPDAPPADGQARRPAEHRPRRLRRPASRPASPTTSAPSRSPRATGSTSSSPSSRRPTTTTPRSSPRPSPTAWPRRSPSGSTSASAASCGATRPTRRSTNPDLIAERYQGIRPAPGYPACPDHTEKAHALRAARGRAHGPGSALTESFAMWPGASVSGYYFWNPASALLRGRPDRPRPARRLRRPQGRAGRRGGALARPEPRRRRRRPRPPRPQLRRRPPVPATAVRLALAAPEPTPNAKRGARPRRTSPAHGLGDPKGRSRLCGAMGSAVSVSPVMAPAARAGEPVVPPPRVSDRVPALVQYFRVIANRTGPHRSGPDRSGPGHRSGADRHRRVGYPRPMTTTTDPALADLLDAARAIAPDVTAIRRRIHRRPEIGMDLPVTQDVIVEELGKIGLDGRRGVALSSVDGDHRGRPARPDRRPPRGHGRAPAPRGHRSGLRLRHGRGDARLRPRRPHGDAPRRGAPAPGTAGRPARPRDPDVPARARRAGTGPG